MEQYILLAECLLPGHMLDWFDLKNVRVEKKGDTQVIHLYLDENEQTRMIEMIYVPMDLHVRACFMTSRLEARRCCFTCAVADGLTQMVTM